MNILIYLCVCLLNIMVATRAGLNVTTAPPRTILRQLEDGKLMGITSPTPRSMLRTTPERLFFAEDCDYLAHHCPKAYITGLICGRTLYFNYYTFKNFCMLEYVNCMERYRIWQLLHMGPCYKVKELDEYMRYPYDDDFFLDQYYVLEDH